MPNNSTTNNKKDKQKNPSFILGLLSGIAGLAVIGMLVFGTLYITNKDKKTNDNQGEVAGQQEEQKKEDTQPQVELSISESDWVLGNPNAKVKVFEFSDFQCLYCAQFHNVMHQIIEEYPNDVSWIYKQFPIASHPLGMPGAIAAECAGEQNKFWQMADIIFENQQTLTENSFENFAGKIGLDVGQYKSCVLSNTHRSKIENDYQTGIEAGVGGTPTNFVNGQMVPGALPYESMKQMVEELLTQ